MGNSVENEDILQELRDIFRYFRVLTLKHSRLSWELNIKSVSPSNKLQLGTIEQEYKEIIKNPRTLDLINKASVIKNLSKKEEAFIHKAKLIYEQYYEPEEVKTTAFLMNTAKSKSINQWNRQRATQPFEFFIPNLETVFKGIKKYLTLKYPKIPPYDAILKTYSPEITADHLAKILDSLLEELTSLNNEILRLYSPFDNPLAGLKFKHKTQVKFIQHMLNTIGEDINIFEGLGNTFNIGPREAGSTYKIEDDSIYTSYYSALHEFGHYDYYTNIRRDIADGILGIPPSIMFEEAIAFIYSDLIGRDQQFLKFWFKELKRFFPDQLIEVSYKDFYIYFHSIKGLEGKLHFGAWVENFIKHILFFKIEKALFDNTLEVKDIKNEYNRLFNQNLDYRLQSEESDLLANITWYTGQFGYIGAYLLATIYTANIFHSISTTQSYIIQELKTGKFESIRYFLSKNIYQYGSIYNGDELIERISGVALNPTYLIDILRKKFIEDFKKVK